MVGLSGRPRRFKTLARARGIEACSAAVRLGLWAGAHLEVSMQTLRPSITVLLTLALLALPSLAAATTMYEFNLSELTYIADLVVEAEVEEVSVERQEASAYLTTVATLRLTHVVKGAAVEGDRVLVREWGGLLNGEKTELPSAPVYVVGERVLVFLEMENRPDALWRTVGLSQGKWTLIEEQDTGRDVALKIAVDRAQTQFDATAVPLPAARTYCDDLVGAVNDDLSIAHVPTYARIPGVPAWKDARFRAEAQAAGQTIDPRWDALRAQLRTYEEARAAQGGE